LRGLSSCLHTGGWGEKLVSDLNLSEVNVKKLGAEEGGNSLRTRLHLKNGGEGDGEEPFKKRGSGRLVKSELCDGEGLSLTSHSNEKGPFIARMINAST